VGVVGVGLWVLGSEGLGFDEGVEDLVLAMLRLGGRWGLGCWVTCPDHTIMLMVPLIWVQESPE
jgi:hypothetical protein